MFRLLVTCFLCFTLGVLPSRADIVINEVVTSASDRLLRYTAGVPKLGTGQSWYENTFNDTMWQSGPGPFGFGTTSPAGPAVGTNTQTRMQYLTPTLYLRKSFNVTAAQAASPDALELVAQYNDGFIVYVNGVELQRRRAGPPKQFQYHDMPSSDPDFNAAGDALDSALNSETINLGAANTKLVAGTNVIAVHALNSSAIQGVFLFSGTLRIGGATPQTLVNANDTWKYFPGVAEPSGGLVDPTRLDSGRLNVPWGTTAYIDTGWTQATGPIGQGASPLGTTLSGIVGVTPSLYVRHVFQATAADVANPAALQLLLSWDDGFVAYLNGVEVARSSNLQTPRTFVPRTAVTNGTNTFSTTTTTFTIDPAVAKLVEGANVLAIQVHNVAIADGDIAIGATLQRQGAATPLVARASGAWKYKIGTEEPVVDLDGAIEDNPDLPESVNDWVELHNNGATAVSMKDWALTDDKTEPGKWVFPDVTIPPGGYLVVMCDGENITTPAPGGFLHADLKLDADGEYLALHNAAGAIVQQFSPGLPTISPFHSLGRNASGVYVFFDPPTPGVANSGTELQGQAADPVFSIPGGIYASTQSVQVTSATAGATIRYTEDGSEPTETTPLKPLPISVTSTGSRNGRVYRARAFAPGYVPSRTVSHTYIVQGNPVPSLPVIALAGDETTSLYRPFGVFAIVNNATANYNGVAWTALGDPLQYNNANYRGQFMERPVNWSMLYPNGSPGFSFDIGLRCAGSPFTRPRFTLTPQNAATLPNAGTWSAQSNWPSMNFYMRNHFSGDQLSFPVIPLSPVTKFSDLRVRAGHNDTNPFIIDELMRRTYVGTGQQGALGANVMLYVNGVYKNIYNITNHVREEFLQQAYGSDLKWDVLQVAVPSDGDLISFQELFTYLRNATGTPESIFQGASSRMDLTNFADYLIANVYGCTGDWPHNNWIAARERSATGKWRFFMWDAEGAFGSFSLTVVSNNFTTTTQQNPLGGNQASLISTAPQTEALSAAARVLYTLLRNNPEFRLLMADRIQKHFFNNGTLTDAAILARKEILRTEVQSLISGYNETRITDWVNGKGDTTRYTVTRNTASPPTISSTTNLPSRRTVLLTGFTNEDSGGNIPLGPVQPYFVTEGLWPATKAPAFNQHGGTFGPNFQLTISNPNGTGSIYYTLNGTDPRQTGGTISPDAKLYTGPLTLPQTLTVKARIRNSNGEWSPATEALFVSSIAPPLLLTEIMYHPADFNDAGTIVNGNEFEFIELKNVGAQPYDLFGLRFTDGIDYAFPAGSSIPANGFVVLAKNPAMFAKKYPNVPVLGGFGPSSSLNNSGEAITLQDGAGNTILTVTYDDQAPWPVDADGIGYSLVPMLPNSNPNPSDATNWRLSGSVNGSPGADDPAPGIPQIRITEVLANSPAPMLDSVELFNPGTEEADISGWYLSDDLGSPKKYRIPPNTIIPPGGYAVLTEAQFNTGLTPFAFSSNGDEAVLSSANAAGALTGLTEFVTFGASEPGVSFGRFSVVRGTFNKTFFTAMASRTFGAANSQPRVGPVIISEVHYAPTLGLPEFIEIRNNGIEPVPLYDPLNPANTWRVTGIGYALPGVVLQPGQFLVISATDPAAFRSSYNLATAVSVYGPFQPEDLSNTGERIALQKPGLPYAGSSGQTIVPYIDVDTVTYASGSPWPSSGSGRSMERGNLFGFGEDPLTWKQSASIGGNVGKFSPLTYNNWQSTQWFVGETSGLGHLADADGDGVTNLMEYFMGLNPRAADAQAGLSASTTMVGGNGPYLTISFRQSLSLPTSGVSYTVEGSSDLLTWDTQATIVGSPLNNGDGTQMVTFRDNTPMAGTTRRFMRVKVVVP
jgi:hypothetical protein